MIRNLFLAVALVAVVLLLAGWLRGRRPSTEAWIEAGELQGRLSRQEETLVVDVRGPEEFAGPLGHIPGAQNLPLDQVEGHAGELASESERPIVLVCHTDRRSASAAELLRERGVADVRVLRGGMVGWNRKGFATE